MILLVVWDSKIHRLHLDGLDRSIDSPGYDNKESDGEAPVLELWGI